MTAGQCGALATPPCSNFIPSNDECEEKQERFASDRILDASNSAANNHIHLRHLDDKQLATLAVNDQQEHQPRHSLWYL